MSKPYTHIIWDFNGTLVDDCWIAVEINCEMNRRRGKPDVTIEDYRDHFAHPPKDFYLKMGYTFERESYAAVSEEFIAEYVARQKEAVLSPGVPQALELFQKAGLSQLVISAHREDLLVPQVADLGIAGYFTDIIGTADAVVSGKIERALLFAAEQKIDLSHAVFLGDTDHDRDTAAALGCDCILYSGGHQSRKRLDSLDVPVLDSIEEIVRWIVPTLTQAK